MDELLKLMADESNPRHAKQHLANHLGVSYQMVKKWFDRGYLPIARAIECEMLWGIDAKTLIDPRIKELFEETLIF